VADGWRLSAVVRTRSGAGPLLRVLAMAVLLFGVLVIGCRLAA
jgi:hypothetical protein